jgi:protease-4
VALFGIAGLIIGLMLVVILLGGLSNIADNTPQISYVYTPEIQPNALGQRELLSEHAPVILKINIKGVIGTDSMTRNSIQKLLVESRERSLKNGRVKAILLDINTPGGTASDSDSIYRAIKAYKEMYQVPVYAYVDGLCASGGMYVAASADKVFASEASLIGSVGVITPSFMNVSQVLEKIGVQSLTLSEGKGKDDLNPLRPWKPGEEDNIKSIITNHYDLFVQILTDNRPTLDKQKLVDVYGASIFPANLAQEYGYIDVSGASLSDTLTALAHKIGIEDNYYQVVELDNKNFLHELFNTKFGLLQGKVTHTLSLSPDMDPALLNQYLYLYRP